MRKDHEKNEEAVSPVVGVMLMLVVTIIIAAVVSGFAGGLASGAKSAPQLTMDVVIKNTGYAASSYILFNVQGVSDPIPTKDLKISTFWSTTNKTAGDGSIVTGGAMVSAGQEDNTHYSSNNYHSPIGFGKGVSDSLVQQKTSGQYPEEQQFGNYTLVPGTTMKNNAVGYAGTSYSYGYGVVNPYEYYANGTYWVDDGDGILEPGESSDGMMAILGYNWNELRPGDLVDIKIIHIPSGKLTFDKSVGVEG
jgi:FlaG/FlaF family flagellin (archaellin)